MRWFSEEEKREEIWVEGIDKRYCDNSFVYKANVHFLGGCADLTFDDIIF